jgi:hypothetical protein
MNIKRFIKKNIYLTIFLAIVFLFGTAYFKSTEGFATNNRCGPSNCKGEYEWVNGKCLLKCNKIWTGSSILSPGSWSCKNTGYGKGQQALSRNTDAYIKVNC